MTQRKNKGLFVTFEGGEGAGKTTLLRCVYQNLKSRGFSVLQTHAPGDTRFGKVLRNILLHDQDICLSKKSELFLFLADRAQHVETKILPYLKKNYIVLCDRFNDSTLAYQGAARALNPPFLEKLCRFASSDLLPHLTFLLDLDPTIGINRCRKDAKSKSLEDKIELEVISFHTKVRAAFLRLAEKEPKRFCILDASATKEVILQKALDAIQITLGS